MDGKEEPLTVQQISYSTNYAKKHCEDILQQLQEEGVVKRKELAKTYFIFYLDPCHSVEARDTLDKVK